jgi:hypothetical protein
LTQVQLLIEVLDNLRLEKTVYKIDHQGSGLNAKAYEDDPGNNVQGRENEVASL